MISCSPPPSSPVSGVPPEKSLRLEGRSLRGWRREKMKKQFLIEFKNLRREISNKLLPLLGTESHRK